MTIASMPAIAVGGEQCLVLRADGTVAAWGCNEAGLWFAL